MRAAYTLAVGSWAIQPSEFWAMSMGDWGWLFEIKRPVRTGTWAGNLTDRQVIDLSTALDEAQRNEQNGKRTV